MPSTRTILTSLAVLAVAGSTAGAIGCSSSSTTTPATGDDASGSSSGTNTAVSFASDVMPIFQQSCTISSVCHGQPNNAAEENLYLGDNDPANNTSTVIGMVYSGLVGVASLEDPKMPLVTASSASTSYLLHKMQGDQNNFASDCAAQSQLCPDPSCNTMTPCGASMPYLGDVLSTTTAGKAQIATIQNWIAQGALNN